MQGMSTIILIMIEHGELTIREVHYREAEQIIQGNKGPVPSMAIPLDGGYLIVDRDKNLLLNAQECFSLPEKLRVIEVR